VKAGLVLVTGGDERFDYRFPKFEDSSEQSRGTFDFALSFGFRRSRRDHFRFALMNACHGFNMRSGGAKSLPFFANYGAEIGLQRR
jgi:hypothetical protein